MAFVQPGYLCYPEGCHAGNTETVAYINVELHTKNGTIWKSPEFLLSVSIGETPSSEMFNVTIYPNSGYLRVVAMGCNSDCDKIKHANHYSCKGNFVASKPNPA